MADIWKDHYIMPWGKYKGEKLANIPGGYFLFLYDGGNGLSKFPELKQYIEDNMDIIKAEAAKEKQR